jgi:hypothetical protein
MRSYILVPVVLLLSMFLNVSQAEMYRWINEKGDVAYGDMPPKDVEAELISADKVTPSGTAFATNQQIEDLHNELDAPQKSEKAKPTDYYCRGYVSDLNKLEIYLEHTVTDRDKQKVIDLRKQIERECD